MREPATGSIHKAVTVAGRGVVRYPLVLHWNGPFRPTCRVRCMPTFVLRLIAPRSNFAQTMTDAEREIMNRHAAH